MKIIPVASSSKGNAYFVENGRKTILIDCGVPFKRLKSVIEETCLVAVLITHNHTDHVSGLKVLLNHVNVPVYSNLMTAEAVAAQEDIPGDAFVCFENGQEFGVGPFEVHPFSIPHDAADPVGYLIQSSGETYFHGTDIGTPLDSVGLKLAKAEIATIESNHDSVMLKTSLRPVSLKQRIAGPRGHLSNDDAAYLIKRFASPHLKKIYLAHLSGECNMSHVALNNMKGALHSIGRDEIDVEVIV